MRAVRLLREAVKLPGDAVIDCAVGFGDHAKAFISKGKRVTGVDVAPARMRHPSYAHVCGSYEDVFIPQADLVWSSHTLEHVPNPGTMLVNFRQWLKTGGYLAIAVPPYPSERFHVGHLTVWTPAHLLYNLVVNGWDCKKARWYTDHDSIGLIVQKTPDIDLSGRTAMLTELGWLNQYMPIDVIHRGDSWWDDNWG